MWKAGGCGSVLRMQIRHMTPVVAAAVCAGAASAALAAGETTPDTTAALPPVLKLALTSAAPLVQGADALGTGPVTIRATSAKGRRFATLVRVSPGADPAAVRRLLDTRYGDPDAVESATSLTLVTGVGATPARPATQRLVLEPGTYVVADTTRQKGAPSTTFTVGETHNGAASAGADATVDMHDYKFTIDRSIAGDDLVRFRNVGRTVHFAASLRVANTRKARALVSRLKQGDEKALERYVTGEGTGVDPIAPGRTVDVRFADKPGAYVFVCFWASKASGRKPHFAKGMVKAVTVRRAAG